MNIKASITFVCLLSHAVAFADPAPTGLFGLPYNPEQAWTHCDTEGWVEYGNAKSHQYHMQLNTALTTPKYHLGEDWNGACGTDTDDGAPLYAIADGQVVLIDSVGTVSGQGKRLFIRYTFPYALATNDVMTFDSSYLHLKSIDAKISWSGAGTGSTVTRGQTVALLGGTGGYSPHLHWGAVTDLALSAGVNPYQKPLTKTHALKYRAPSLIVDDRRDVINFNALVAGKWTIFTMIANAPSSTVYVKFKDQRKSLRNAIAAGWIPSEGMLFEKDAAFYYYADVDKNFFEKGKRYAFKTLLVGVSIHILVPRNGFQQDRARLDMLHAVKSDSRFQYVRTETYVHKPDWDTLWEYHSMSFDNIANYLTPVAQITYKKNPLLRYTAFQDPSTGKWSSWKKVDWNRLY